ncbi:hypothetical protein Slin14017_G062370 [Septoria linicola]|nr:hypothetical protein Slin14017_G062370 [Septoria linicola]
MPFAARQGNQSFAATGLHIDVENGINHRDQAISQASFAIDDIGARNQSEDKDREDEGREDKVQVGKRKRGKSHARPAKRRQLSKDEGTDADENIGLSKRERVRKAGTQVTREKSETSKKRKRVQPADSEATQSEADPTPAKKRRGRPPKSEAAKLTAAKREKKQMSADTGKSKNETSVVSRHGPSSNEKLYTSGAAAGPHSLDNVFATFNKKSTPIKPKSRAPPATKRPKATPKVEVNEEDDASGESDSEAVVEPAFPSNPYTAPAEIASNPADIAKVFQAPGPSAMRPQNAGKRPRKTVSTQQTSRTASIVQSIHAPTPQRPNNGSMLQSMTQEVCTVSTPKESSTPSKMENSRANNVKIDTPSRVTNRGDEMMRCTLPSQLGFDQCDKRTLGPNRARSMLDHIRRVHPEHYSPAQRATEENVKRMFESPAKLDKTGDTGAKDRNAQQSTPTKAAAPKRSNVVKPTAQYAASKDDWKLSAPTLEPASEALKLTDAPIKEQQIQHCAPVAQMWATPLEGDQTTAAKAPAIDQGAQRMPLPAAAAISQYEAALGNMLQQRGQQLHRGEVITSPHAPPSRHQASLPMNGKDRPASRADSAAVPSLSIQPGSHMRSQSTALQHQTQQNPVCPPHAQAQVYIPGSHMSPRTQMTHRPPFRAEPAMPVTMHTPVPLTLPHAGWSSQSGDESMGFQQYAQRQSTGLPQNGSQVHAAALRMAPMNGHGDRPPSRPGPEPRPSMAPISNASRSETSTTASPKIDRQTHTRTLSNGTKGSLASPQHSSSHSRRSSLNSTPRPQAIENGQYGSPSSNMRPPSLTPTQFAQQQSVYWNQQGPQHHLHASPSRHGFIGQPSIAPFLSPRVPYMPQPSRRPSAYHSFPPYMPGQLYGEMGRPRWDPQGILEGPGHISEVARQASFNGHPRGCGCEDCRPGFACRP